MPLFLNTLALHPTAVMYCCEFPPQAHPEFLTGWQAQLWTRFFCLAVYSTMYLNDHNFAHADLYGLLGMNPTVYNRCVLVITCYNEYEQGRTC
jgi:hypothetical protein